jgi:hypothetical protein
MKSFIGFVFEPQYSEKRRACRKFLLKNQSNEICCFLSWVKSSQHISFVAGKNGADADGLPEVASIHNQVVFTVPFLSKRPYKPGELHN